MVKEIINKENTKDKINPVVWTWDYRYELVVLNIGSKIEGYRDEEMERFWIWISLKEMDSVDVCVCACAKYNMIFWIEFWNKKDSSGKTDEI